MASNYRRTRRAGYASWQRRMRLLVRRCRHIAADAATDDAVDHTDDDDDDDDDGIGDDGAGV